MEIPNLTLAYAVLESKTAIENSLVKKIQELENNWLKIKLHSKQGAKDLILAPQIFFFSSYLIPAKQQSSGFGGFLRKHLEGKKILAFFQHEFDRIVVFEFQEFFLIAELFAKGNTILADKKMKILGVLRTEEWKDRQLKKGAEYKWPSSKGINPLKIHFEEFAQLLSESELDIARALIRHINIAPIIAEEILFESKIPKEKPAKQISKKELQKIIETIENFYSVRNEKLKPVIAKKGSSEIILPFALKEAETIKELDSLNSGFEEFFSGSFSSNEQKKADVFASKKILDLRKSLESQKESKIKFEQSIELNRKKAEAIFAHYLEIKEVLGLLKKAKLDKENQKEVMYKLSSFGFVKSFELKKNSVIVKFE